jgi:ABC-type lipoprotein export system ATPase subunit
MIIERVSVYGGQGKKGNPEPVELVEFKMGDVISIVGSTGSGKTTFINDIELFAYGNTPTGRKVLINGKPAPQEYKDNPASNPIALITQHTTFLSDLPVYEFLMAHAGIRSKSKSSMEEMVQKTLDFANQLTGEPIVLKSRMTELSGGQTRSLMIADATIICNTPIVLLDEVENAGINRTKALELLKQYHKIFIFVTHDPRIALLSDFRIVMENGCMTQIQQSNAQEQTFSQKVGKLDGILSGLRDKIRRGETLTGRELEGIV